MKYHVCLSFAGTERDLARSIATELQKLGILVFFDEFEKARLWGAFLHDALGSIYYEAYYAIVLLSAQYYERMYTNVERKALLLSGGDKMLPVKVDDAEVPIALRGIGYLDAKSETAESIAALTKQKLEQDRKLARDSLDYLFSKNKFEEGAALGEKLLSRFGGSSETPDHAPTHGFLLYNTACCYSRLAEKYSQSKRPFRDELDKATAYVEAWLADRGLRLDLYEPSAAIKCLNDDDDLLFLRQERSVHFSVLFEKHGGPRISVNRRATGSPGGCVGSDMLIETMAGPVPAGSVQVGDRVTSIDPYGGTEGTCLVKMVNRTIADSWLVINGALEVPRTQVLFAKGSGWLKASELREGDQLLTRDGYAPIRGIVVVEGQCEHLWFELDATPHSFLCEGFVCHNLKM